jgi:hypothetical protein
MTTRLVATLFAVLAFVSGSFVPLEANSRSPVVRGTINVVLANGNGMVAVTDSMQTLTYPSAPPKQSPEPGQKLFRLDDRTVCTIAGFGSATIPAMPEFTNSAIGILEEFKNQSAANSTLTFDDKLHFIAFIFKSYLEDIANLRDSGHPGDYSFELLMAGYDLDGTSKIAELILTTTLSTANWTLSKAALFSTVITDIQVQTVGSGLAYYLAGQPAVAKSLLDNPSPVEQSDILRKYARSLASNGGSSLTLVDLKDLALLLAHRTAVGNPTVGGQDQVAVLHDHKIQSFDQPMFKQPHVGPAFILMVGDWDETGREPVLTPLPSILIKCRLTNKTSYHLDNKYFFRSEIVNSQLTYDGGPTNLDKSNHVTKSILILGAGAKKNPRRVEQLKRNFRW